MKYWLLTTEYPPQFGGGIGTYCFQWSSILKREDIDLTIFILNKNEKAFKENFSDHVRMVEFSPYLKDTSAFLGYETMVSYSFEEIVRQYIEKEGPPDWLEAQEYQGIAYFLLHKKHLGEDLYKDLKILITCHCPSFITFEYNHINTYQLPYFWIGEMERFCMKAGDICIFPSQYLADEIAHRYPGLVKNYYIIHNPYLTPGKPAKLLREENDFVIVGKLSPAKGILKTLKVFEKLWNKGYSCRLKLIGDENYFYHAAGSTTGDLIKNLYSSFLDSGLLTITGELIPADVKQEIQKAKIVLAPSAVENLPYTVIEAMALGKIVLASDQGGQKEIIHDGYNGFLFDYDDTLSWEEKIIKVWHLSTGEIEKITANAVQTITDKCEPGHYFRKKLEILNKYSPSSENNFPFVSAVENKKAYAPETNKSKDLLSVVIPYFNMGKYIGEAIASIDQSTYREKEIIIVNDGSNDTESIDVLQSFKSRKDIKIINQENSGLSAARNKGALEAAGEYLAFLDPDDLVAKEYYQKAINIIGQKANVHFVGCWVQYFEGSNGKWPTFTPEPPFLLYHNMVNSSSLVYRKGSFLKSGLNDSKFLYGMEDYDSVVSLVENGYNGVTIPEFLFYYRVRKNSMARKFNTSNKLYLYQLLAEKHKQFYATFATEVFGLLNANGPGIFLDNPSLDHHLGKKIPFGGSLSRKLIYLVKKNRLTRKMAYRLYRLLNK